jgi:hypothetical protein
MNVRKIWSARAADLRRMAAMTQDAERQRLMLRIAEQLEEDAAAEEHPAVEGSGRATTS